MASLSLYPQFETNLMSNRKVIEFLLQLKSTKTHGKNYIKVRPPLVRHLLRNRLLCCLQISEFERSCVQLIASCEPAFSVSTKNMQMPDKIIRGFLLGYKYAEIKWTHYSAVHCDVVIKIFYRKFKIVDGI